MTKRSRYKKIVAKIDETPETLRKNFPSNLISAFVAASKSNWNVKEHKKYATLAEEFLGKTKWSDKIEQGALVVRLTIATFDLIESKNKTLVCDKHKKYDGTKKPKNKCKTCAVIYEKKNEKEIETKES